MHAEGIVYEAKNSASYGAISYYVTGTEKWAVSLSAMWGRLKMIVLFKKLRHKSLQLTPQNFTKLQGCPQDHLDTMA